MLFVQVIPEKFESAYSYPVAEFYPAVLGILTSGSYALIPFAQDDFESYATGFRNQFSGDGFWNGSGYSNRFNVYESETFDEYATGIYNFYTGLTLGTTISGYSTLIGLFTGVLYNYQNSGFSRTMFFDDDFESYAVGARTSFTGGASFVVTNRFSGYQNTPSYTGFSTTTTGFQSIGIVATGAP